MPKIEVRRRELLELACVPDPGDAGLENLLLPLKAELDGVEGDALKIELKDTNRPDLWCVEGVARGIRCLERGREDRLSAAGAPVPLRVDPELRRVRPYIAGFLASGWTLDEEGLAALLAVQEKLAEAFGKKRSLAAIGFHRAGEIVFPVRYLAAADSARMVPLGTDGEMTLRRVLEETEKGREYAHLLEGLDRFPVLADADGRIFSFPPILNSNTTGRVRTGDSDLFCDVTGTDWETVQLTATILACNLEDRGAAITPLEVDYPYDVPGGSRRGITPVRFADTLTATTADILRVLGTRIPPERIPEILGRMDYAFVEVRDDGTVTGTLPPYRRDGIHAVDMIEDIAVSVGLDAFPPLLPAEFTIGRSAPVEELADAVRTILAGAGCEEILRPVLTSRERLVALSRTPDRPVAIANPMTAEYGVVRNSLLPGLLEVESTSAHAAFPHRTFETGEVLLAGAEGLCSTATLLACLVSGNAADLGDVHSVLGALCRERGIELSLEPCEDPRFIPGRAGSVLLDGHRAGVLGELHPAVLTDWGIARPAAGFEIVLDALGAGCRSSG